MSNTSTMGYLPSSSTVYSGAERDADAQPRVAHLDLVFCSSEDDNCPAHNLQTRCAPHQDLHAIDDRTRDYSLLPVLHGGWESEKFCEYPQELVFRVNRGIPTRIDSLHILSHHSKITSRVEVFTSCSTPHRQLYKSIEGETTTTATAATADFQRLGFASFQSNETMAFSSRELKIVRLHSHEKVMLIRLVLHRCHANRHNLFQQVGLLSVVASSSRQKKKSLHNSASWSPEKSGFLPSLYSIGATAQEQQLGVCGESTDHLFSSSLSPLRAKYAANLVVAPDRSSPAKKVASAPTLLLLPHHGAPMDSATTTEYEVWIPELHEFRTPLQIATRVRLCRELVANESGNGSQTAPFWCAMDLECRHLLTKLDILQRTYDDTSHLIAVDDRIAMHEEIDHVVRDFGAIGSKAFASELEMIGQEREASYVLNREPDVSLFQVFPDLKRGLEAESWQSREELVWNVVEHLQTAKADAKAKLRSLSSTLEVEALAIAKQEPASLKTHKKLAEVLEVLLQRLDDRQAVIRNNAAFSILKIGELSRAMGTFVMHSILKKLEGSNRQQQQQQLRVADQVLHAVLKLFTALLQSFHCCASIDIAPRRVLRFLLKSDADMHANPHIRDAAKQLTLVMYNEVGPEVMEGYVSKLPSEVQEMYQQQFKLNDEKKKVTAHNKHTITTNETGS